MVRPGDKKLTGEDIFFGIASEKSYIHKQVQSEDVIEKGE
jgi:hypothetical protein